MLHTYAWPIVLLVASCGGISERSEGEGRSEPGGQGAAS